ncbi:MAG: aminotransferase class I/II-fold pyridoxal phosphate-dependent enzyme [Deltaproteobacteria bacterium]|nr:aminotransferase class I/II-fold pyridoxal phosphate-dependent enzyme [Deltaproteobacteria bacterium]
MPLGSPSEGPGLRLRRQTPPGDATLNPDFNEFLRPLLARSNGAARAELQSLADETDPQLFYDGLLNYGARQEQSGAVETAAEIYAALGTRAPEPLRTRAAQRLDAVMGRGSFGGRLEFLGRHFAREAADPAMLLAMTAGSAVFTLSRGVFLSRLLASPATGFLSRGLGARALASTGAFFLEIPAFWATGKGLREVLSPGSQRWDAETNLSELAGAGLTLGALKLTGFLSGAAYQRFAGPAGAVGERPMQHLFTQTGMLTGILLGRRLEEGVGLRRPVDGATTLVDSLVMLLQFHVGGRLSQSLMGDGFARGVRELETRLDRLEPRRPSPRRPFHIGAEPLLAAAGTAPPLSERGEPDPLSPARPLFMTMEGEGGAGSVVGSRTWSELLRQVSERGKENEVRALRTLLQEILSAPNFRGYTPRLQEKMASRDPQQWREAVRIVGDLLSRDPRLKQGVESSAAIKEFGADWVSRPHFASGAQVPYAIAKGTPRAYSIQQRLMPDLLRAMAENPSLQGWRAYSRPLLARGVILGEQSFAEADGNTRVHANWKTAGMQLRFDARGHLAAPLEVRGPYTSEEWAALSRPDPAPELPALGPRQSQEFARQKGENSSLWAQRLLETSREGEDRALAVAQFLEENMDKPETAFHVRELVERLISLTSSSPEGQGILARHYSLPGVRDPLTIVSLPTTFLPEQWSRVFAEGVVQEFQRDRRPVDLAVEIGSGTGWVSILTAKLGMAREVVGVDRNPHAPVIGRLNAALNGVKNVSFQSGDLLAPLSEGAKVDLLLACLPQVPRSGGVESLRSVADYYPSDGNYWDRYGLGLIDKALGQARTRLSEGGRVLFNLGGRPGRAVLEELLARRGFHPAVRYAQLIQQDPTTDFSELARLESDNNHRFEFFLKEDPQTPISAAEAVGRGEVHHMLYLTEGRPYADLLRDSLGAVTGKVERWGYTENPGSENVALRESLALELSRQWGAKIAPEMLFVGPSSDLLMDGILHVVLPDQGRVLYAAPAADAEPAGLQAFQALRSPANPAEILQAVRRENPDALVLKLSREAWEDPAIPPLLQAAVEQKRHVVVLVDHPSDPQGSMHPAARYLNENPATVPYLHVVQSLDSRYGAPALPLAVAMIGNSAVQGLLARYADLTYSRTSTLVQAAYQKFLTDLPQGILAPASPSGAIEPMLTSFESGSAVVRALESPSAFDSGPKGEHPDPIDMSFGESEWRAPLRLDAALLAASRRSRGEVESEAREAVAAYLMQSRGARFEPEQIVLGAGVQPLLVSAIRGLKAVAGAPVVEVAVPKPSYGLFFPAVEIAGARRAELMTLEEEGFRLRPMSVPWSNGGRRGALRALLVNEPTNPAGQYYSAAQWKEIAGSLRSAGGYLLFDDVFGMLDFGRIRGRRAPSLQTLQKELGPNLVAFGGLSKEFAAGGLRFGFAASQNPALVSAMRGNLLATPDPLAMAAAPEFLRNWEGFVTPHRFYLSSRASALEQVFLDRHLNVTPVQGGYAMFVDLSPLHGRQIRLRSGESARITHLNLHELLFTEAGIKVHSEAWAGVAGRYRFVFSIERLDEAVQRLNKFFRSAR